MCTQSHAAGDETGYDPTTGTYHATFEPTAPDDSVVVAIVTAVATATNRSVTALEPLYWTVDAESLAVLLASSPTDPIEVAFTYEDCRVTVSSHGTVVVDPSE
ncbi:HalOD1 output domain-containing protein [Natrialbaceae archaeon GCM10025810]|uniref:HalOD1 output domain-containing protein n=1 Tax=Halovalidus salilacus TaxID=3075124 RepID=UPI003621403C